MCAALQPLAQALTPPRQVLPRRDQRGAAWSPTAPAPASLAPTPSPTQAPRDLVGDGDSPVRVTPRALASTQNVSRTPHPRTVLLSASGDARLLGAPVMERTVLG